MGRMERGAVVRRIFLAVPASPLLLFPVRLQASTFERLADSFGSDSKLSAAESANLFDGSMGKSPKGAVLASGMPAAQGSAELSTFQAAQLRGLKNDRIRDDGVRAPSTPGKRIIEIDREISEARGLATLGCFIAVGGGIIAIAFMGNFNIAGAAFGTGIVVAGLGLALSQEKKVKSLEQEKAQLFDGLNAQ